MTGDHDATRARFEARLASTELTDYVLTLFVSGASELSARAIENARTICDGYLAGRYHLRVIDIHRDLQLTLTYNVLAAPTLVREAPLPIRRLVGDLSDSAGVLAALEIRSARSPSGLVPQ